MNRGRLSVTVLLVIAMVLSSCLFVVKETERAVVLKFGEVVRPDVEPGLHWKIPFVHTVRRFDGRIQTMDARAERYLTLEKKALMVDAFAKWRIIDVRKYYTATQGEEARAQSLLGQRINDGLRNEIGRRDMHEVVSGERDQLMEALTRELNSVAQSELGVEVVDIRVKRIDLPAEVSPKVYERMKSEREREAREHRSRGQELAEGIRASADRERTIISSEAYRDAERLKAASATSRMCWSFHRIVTSLNICNRRLASINYAGRRAPLVHRGGAAIAATVEYHFATGAPRFFFANSFLPIALYQ